MLLVIFERANCAFGDGKYGISEFWGQIDMQGGVIDRAIDMIPNFQKHPPG